MVTYIGGTLYQKELLNSDVEERDLYDHLNNDGRTKMWNVHYAVYVINSGYQIESEYGSDGHKMAFELIEVGEDYVR